MALYTIHDKYKIYKGEKSAERYFRKDLSKRMIETFGKGPYTQDEIREIVVFSVNYYINQFIGICNKETAFYFYQSVMMFHEDAVEISILHQGETGSTLITRDYLAMYRRILKYIMEAGCDVNMVVVSPPKGERQRIEKVLDDLLFLGDMIMSCVSIYAEQGMIEDVGDVYFDENELYVFTRRHHYNVIFKHIIDETRSQYEKVVVDMEGFNDMAIALKDCFGIDYADVGNLIAHIHEQLGDQTEGFGWETLPQYMHEWYHVPHDIAVEFFRGLTLTKDNKMSLLDLACKPNNLNRLLYNPIVIWTVGSREYAVCGKNIWTEAMIQYATNAIPWGKAPAEWLKNKKFKSFVNRKEDEHDKWLDEAAEQVLKTSQCRYERNVKKLDTINGFVDIDVQGLGEIDFIIVAPEVKKIFLMDCKHLTTRYDTPNQKNDFNNFTQGSKKRKSYNETMSNKVTWFRQHPAILSSYVEKLTNGATTITGYKIEGIFLINTPTLYMYNSEFRIYCISDLKAVVEGTYLDKTFLVHIDGEDQVKMLKIEYPYFRKPSYAVIDPFLDD